MQSTIKNISKNSYKGVDTANPILPAVFCADPTAVEYNGRLYVYGTSDQQQFDIEGDKPNTYQHIKSLEIMSTDDMANWEYHGRIPTGEIAPWIYASWAPSILSRVEADDKTHFYLYFSHSGAGVGVITATDPVGPWSDPLGRPLVCRDTEGVGDCEAPFDPGVCIDENGTGWLSFGGGSPNKSVGTEYMPGNARLVRLGDDMVSLGSEIISINAPYHFEANEMNVIGDTYVYTYNTSWSSRDEWDSDAMGVSAPTRCSMCYMTNKNPLDANGWKYQSHYFLNPGDFGMHDSNNHTHLHKFCGRWYMLYHTLTLIENMPIDTDLGYRSMCVNEIEVDEQTLSIKTQAGNRKGAEQIKSLDPFKKHSGAELFTFADMEYVQLDGFCGVKSNVGGAWVCIKGVDFSGGANKLNAMLSGRGVVEVKLDNVSSDEAVCCISVDGDVSAVCESVSISGKHDVYLVFSEKGITLQSWIFE